MIQSKRPEIDYYNLAQKCSRCGQPNPAIWYEAVGCECRAPMDACDLCRTDLCERCMAAGCCGHTPAVSEDDERMTALWGKDWRL